MYTIAHCTDNTLNEVVVVLYFMLLITHNKANISNKYQFKIISMATILNCTKYFSIDVESSVFVLCANDNEIKAIRFTLDGFTY